MAMEAEVGVVWPQIKECLLSSMKEKKKNSSYHNRKQESSLLSQLMNSPCLKGYKQERGLWLL